MGVPIKYRNERERMLTSFDWIDVASGTGNETYWLVKTKDTDGDVYSLVPSTSIAGVQGSSGYSLEATNRSFDTTVFNLPQTIRGTVYFTGQFNFVAADGNITASLFHYDGTDETLIGAEATSATEAADANFSLAFEVTERLFKRGDLIRLKVKYSDSGLFISIDPTATIIPTITPSKLVVPYKVQT